jgi:hypothetical protein
LNSSLSILFHIPNTFSNDREEDKTTLLKTEHSEARNEGVDKDKAQDKDKDKDTNDKQVVVISFPEMAGDLCKYIVFNSLAVNADWRTKAIEVTDTQQNALFFLFGAVSAVAGKFLQDFLIEWKKRPSSSSSSLLPLLSAPLLSTSLQVPLKTSPPLRQPCRRCLSSLLIQILRALQ